MYFNKLVELACCTSTANTACNYLYLLKNVKSLESVVIDWLQ